MSDKVVESTVGKRRRTRGGMVVVLILLAVGLAGTPYIARPVTAGTLDPHVVAFGASPSYINLAMTTTVTVEIGSLYGAQDDYLATVIAPGGGTATAWYNFTTVGSKSVIYGDATLGFNASVDLVGTYELQLEYFNGTGFSLAAIAQFSATSQLFVVTEAATASNEYTDVHNCPIAQEFQRGGEVIGRVYVTYASTGGFVNGTATPSARGNITGTLFGLTKALSWQNVYHFWRAAWFPMWNETLGVIQFSASASDGLGNFGSAVSPPFGLTAWKIIPAVLKVVATIQNETGVPTVLFERGDTLRVNARITYEGHNAHNRAFPGPMNETRGGQATALLGYGPFNVTSGQFESTLATLSMTLDSATQNWTASYTIPNSAPIRSDLQVVVLASDGANPPNTGRVFSTLFAFEEPPASPPPPSPQSTGFDLTTVGFVAAVTLLAGLAVGVAMSRRRRAKPAEAEKAPAKEEPEDEWEVQEGESK